MICGIRLLRVLSLLPSDCRRHKGCWSRSQERILMCGLVRNRNSMNIHPKSAHHPKGPPGREGRSCRSRPARRDRGRETLPDFRENRDLSPGSPFLGWQTPFALPPPDPPPWQRPGEEAVRLMVQIIAGMQSLSYVGSVIAL